MRTIWSKFNASFSDAIQAMKAIQSRTLGSLLTTRYKIKIKNGKLLKRGIAAHLLKSQMIIKPNASLFSLSQSVKQTKLE
jgi:hypothetical protein